VKKKSILIFKIYYIPPSLVAPLTLASQVTA